MTVYGPKVAKMGKNGRIFGFIWTSGNAIDVISIQQLDNVVFYRLCYLNRGRCTQIWHKSPKTLQNWVAIAAVFGRFSYRIPVPHKILGDSWLACVVWLFVLGLGFRLRPATPAWGVWVCVCFCARSAPYPPLLAGVCGVGVCAWARVSVVPHHSWLGCWGVCAFVRAIRLYRAYPGWGARCGCVCLGSGFGCTPPLLAVTPQLVAGVCGVSVCVLGLGFCCAPPLLEGVFGWLCVCVRAPLVPRHSWLGFALWMCVLGLGLRLRPATPGLDVQVFLCLCARSARTLLLRAGVWGMGVCVRALVSAAPCHSRLRCWGMCVFVCALRLEAATPGWAVRRGCVCWGSGLGCAPPLLAEVLGYVCVCVRAPLVPCHPWLGCAAWVCVFGLGFRLRPATLG